MDWGELPKTRLYGNDGLRGEWRGKMRHYKDLSRMGRNYRKSECLRKSLSPKGVRFIAINDGVDSAQGDNDLTPLKIFLTNGW